MYAVLHSYTFDPAASAELSRQINEVWLPQLRRMPGFATCYWLDSGTGAGAVLCTFEDAACAQAALTLLAGCATFHRMMLDDSPQVLAGAVTAYANAGL